jgi:hypothetical protein
MAAKHACVLADPNAFLSSHVNGTELAGEL